jgi:hypothetical protein
MRTRLLVSLFQQVADIQCDEGKMNWIFLVMFPVAAAVASAFLGTFFGIWIDNAMDRRRPNDEQHQS